MNPLASSPCMAGEGDPAHVDAEQARDVAVWRKAERSRLLAERAAMTVEARHAASAAVTLHLDKVLAERFPSLVGQVISAWWPIKAELNLRHWLQGLAARGAIAALPVVTAQGAPLTFRRWTADSRMERGIWNIPVPADGPPVTPDITLSPLVGWDAAGYRLGYGGGYFDRTLAALSPRPYAIGIGLDAARLSTIFPQPHDIAMQMIVTESGLHTPRPAP